MLKLKFLFRFSPIVFLFLFPDSDFDLFLHRCVWFTSEFCSSYFLMFGFMMSTCSLGLPCVSICCFPLSHSGHFCLIVLFGLLNVSMTLSVTSYFTLKDCFLSCCESFFHPVCSPLIPPIVFTCWWLCSPLFRSRMFLISDLILCIYSFVLLFSYLFGLLCTEAWGLYSKVGVCLTWLMSRLP